MLYSMVLRTYRMLIIYGRDYSVYYNRFTCEENLMIVRAISEGIKNGGAIADQIPDKFKNIIKNSVKFHMRRMTMFSLIYEHGDITLRMSKNNNRFDIWVLRTETILDSLTFEQSSSLTTGNPLSIDDEMGWKLCESCCEVDELKICEKLYGGNISIVIEKEHFGIDISKNAKKIHTFLYKNVSARTYEELKVMFK